MQIIIEQGKEFNYKIGNVTEDDIFINEYNQAALRLEEIVTATKNYEAKIKENKEHGVKESDYLNNIIAFTGERGQGKSSAMHSFSQDLCDNRNKSTVNVKYGDNTKAAEFRKLETIDPSTFEDMHNVLEVVIARMFNDFEEKYNSSDDDFKAQAKKLEILNSFQKVYESLSFLRNSKKIDDIGTDYEGSIQKIARIGDSTNLKKEMAKLVDSYLKLFIEDATNRFLIIPIDDLDINIENAYKISEQIRKYLIIPHVVIIMAVKIEQLKQCVEKEYRGQLKYLIEAKNRLSDDEPVNMAAKYVEKLIPDGRKISLPEIRAISQSGKDAVEIIFNKNSKKDKDGKLTSLLDKYKSNNAINKKGQGDSEGNNSGKSESSNDKNEKSQEDSLGIEKTLLAFIHDKTGIVFVKPENSVHPIVPNTMRELVNILSVLGKMEDYIKDGIEDNVLRLKNIKLFEDYFMHTWVPTNLDDGHVRTINELWHKSTFEKHQFICLEIINKLEKLDAFSLDNKLDRNSDDTIKLLDITAKELYKKFSEKNNNCLSYSVGDVASLLDLLSTRFIDKQISNFAFTVKTLYTMTMHKLAYYEISEETRNESDEVNKEPNEIYKFVGGDLWGETKKNVIRGGRGKFEFNPKSIIEKLPDKGNKLSKKVASEIKDDLLYLVFFSNCSSKQDKYGEIVYQNEFLSSNGHCREEIQFSIDNLFVSALDLVFTYTKSGLQNYELSSGSDYKSLIENIINRELIIKITINYELNEYIKQYCIKTNNTKGLKNEASNIDFLTHFIRMIRNSLNQIDYIEYFAKDYWILFNPREISKSIIDSHLVVKYELLKEIILQRNKLVKYFLKCLETGKPARQDGIITKSNKISIVSIMEKIYFCKLEQYSSDKISELLTMYEENSENWFTTTDVRVKELAKLLDTEINNRIEASNTVQPDEPQNPGSQT